MDAVKSWLQDRKNLPVVVAGTAVILVAVVFLLLRLSATSSTNTASTPPADMPAAGAGGPSPAGVPEAGGGPGMPGGASPATPAATPAVSKEALLPYRKDPFKPFTRKPNRTQILISMLPSISHVRIAPAPVKKLGAVEVVTETLPPQPVRRMAGVLMNSKISAILETDGRSDIVTPGMVVNRSGSRVRVESITPDQIVLKTLDTKKPFTVRVNLQGSIVTSDSDESPVGGGDGVIAPIM